MPVQRTNRKCVPYAGKGVVRPEPTPENQEDTTGTQTGPTAVNLFDEVFIGLR